MTLYANSVEKGSAILDYGTDNEGQITFGQISSNLVLEVSAYEEIETYEAEIFNTYGDLDIELFYKDSNNEYVKITDLENIEKGTIVYVKLTSTGNAYMAGVFTEADIPLLSGVVQAGSSTFIGSFEIKENVGIETAEYSEVTITYTSIDGVTIRALDQNNNTIASGSSVFMGIIICFEIVNSTDNKVTINFEIGEMSLGFAVDANATKTTEYTAIPSDCTLSVVEYVEYTVTVNLNGFDSDITYSLVTLTAEGYDYLQSGDTITKNSPLLVMFTEFPNDPILMLTLKNGETIVYNNVITAYDYEENVIFVNGNVTITVSQAMIPGDTYTIENSIDIDDLDVTITVAGQPYVEDEEIEEETTIVVSVENNTNSSFYIYAFDATTEDYVAETKIVNPKQTIAITFNISCNVFIGCEVIDSPNMFYINDTIDNDEIEIEIDVNGEECEDLDNILEGSIVSIYVYNGSTETYTVYVVNDYTDQVLTNCTTISNGENCLLEFEIHIDARLVYELYASSYNFIDLIDATDLDVSITVDGEPLTSNTINRGAAVVVHITNNSKIYPRYISILDEDDNSFGNLNLDPGEDGQVSFTMNCDLWMDFYDGEPIIDAYTVSLFDDYEEFEIYLSIGDEDVNFGDLIDKDETVTVTVFNSTDYSYRLSLYILGEDEEFAYKIIASGIEGFISFSISDDVIVKLTEAGDDLGHFSLANYVDDEDVVLEIIVNDSEYDPDALIDEGTSIYVHADNNSELPIKVFICRYDNDEVIDFLEIDPGYGDYLYFNIDCDTYITFNYVEEELYFIEIENEVDADIEGTYVDIDEETYNIDYDESYAYGTELDFVITNNESFPIIACAMIEDEEVDYVIVYENDYGNLSFELTGDVVIFIEKYIEDVDDFYLNIYNYNYVNAEYVVTDAEENSFYDGDVITNVGHLYVTVTNSEEFTICIRVIDGDPTEFILDELLEAGQTQTYDFDHSYTVSIILCIRANYLITVDCSTPNLHFSLCDDFDIYYFSGDYFTFANDDIKFIGKNVSEDKIYKMTAYDNDDTIIGVLWFYQAVGEVDYEDYCWMTLNSDVTFVITEENPNTYTLTIDTDYSVKVERGDFEITDGAIIYEEESLCISFYNETEDIIIVQAFDEDNELICSFACAPGGSNWDYSDPVYSNVRVYAYIDNDYPIDD